MASIILSSWEYLDESLGTMVTVWYWSSPELRTTCKRKHLPSLPPALPRGEYLVDLLIGSEKEKKILAIN